jgi:hypothetical protein
MTTISQKVYEDPEPKKYSVKYHLAGTQGQYRPAHYVPKEDLPRGKAPKQIRVTVEAVE